MTRQKQALPGERAQRILERVYSAQSMERVFNRATLRAVQRWKYEPMLAAGRPTDRPGMRTRLVFEIEAEDRS